LIRVVKERLVTFKELKDGSITMEDVWTMNDWLDLSNYIDRALEEKMKEGAKQ